MSDERPAFQIDPSALRSRPKGDSAEALRQAEAAGEAHGFVDRSSRRRPGRRASPRTGQVHAKVLPEVATEIADEAARRGTTQGVIIEEAWVLYKSKQHN